MIAFGLPPNLARQWQTLYTQLVRYIKVHGAFSKPFHTTNGIGQGDSISILIANMWVTMQFTMIRELHPRVQMGAYLDDRNLIASNYWDIHQSIICGMEMDEAGGHVTNIGKSAVHANTKDVNILFGKQDYGDQRLAILDQTVLVGYTFAVKRRTDKQHINARCDRAIEAARRISRIPQAAGIRTALVMGSAIPKNALRHPVGVAQPEQAQGGD